MFFTHTTIIRIYRSQFNSNNVSFNIFYKIIWFVPFCYDLNS